MTIKINNRGDFFQLAKNNYIKSEDLPQLYFPHKNSSSTSDPLKLEYRSNME